MKQFDGEASVQVRATPEAAFDLITDIDRLPEWNRAIEALADRPAALAPGAEWTVTMHPPRGPRWGSVSRAEEVDRQRLRFRYQTRNTDGNPSYVTWSWQVDPAADGAAVTVRWDCYLKTADRRLLLGPIRKRQLAREVPRSLVALAGTLAAADAAPVPD